MRDGAPLADLFVRGPVALEPADDRVRDRPPEPHGDAGELRHGAEVVVEELAVDRRVLVVEALVRLQRDEDDRARELAHERREGRARRVGDHVDEEQVEVGRLHRRDHRRGVLRVVRHAEARDGDREAGELRDEGVLLALHVVEEAGALGPVGVEADAHDADVRGERLAAVDMGREGVVHGGKGLWTSPRG